MSATIKIVNGTPVPSVNTYPWFCQIIQSDDICGGVYMGNNCVLTAAHCFFKNGVFVNNPESWKVRMGTLNIDSGGITYSVNAIIPNPNFSDLSNNNDVCILKLNGNPASDGFEPVNLITSELSPILEVVGKNAIVMGFGRIGSGKPFSPVLLEADVVIRSVGNADGTGYTPDEITSEMLTAGNINPDRDACQGDSGGPLVALDINTAKLYQIGIVSWGYGCGDPEFPGVYTRISQYLDWIQSVCPLIPITIQELCYQITSAISNIKHKVVDLAHADINVSNAIYILNVLHIRDMINDEEYNATLKLLEKASCCITKLTLYLEKNCRPEEHKVNRAIHKILEYLCEAKKIVC